MHGRSNVMVLFFSLLFLPNLLHSQEKGTFKDIRDGQVYNWVKAGTQAWMTENLRFNVSPGSWVYNNDSTTPVGFGRLYTWKAAQTACPKGWHLPTEKEWGLLIQSLGGSGQAGLAMQSMDTIGQPEAISGMAPRPKSSLLGGVRHPDGSCTGLNFWGGCWSAGKINDTVASNVLFVHGAKDVGISTNDKNSGFSVRCFRK